MKVDGLINTTCLLEREGIRKITATSVVDVMLLVIARMAWQHKRSLSFKPPTHRLWKTCASRSVILPHKLERASRKNKLDWRRRSSNIAD
jgi:hypothetical protein